MKTLPFQIRKSIVNSTPFEGSDETWKQQYGKDWQAKKQEYYALLKNKVNKLRNKILNQ